MFRNVMLLSLLALLAPLLHASDEKSDQTALQGTWLPASAELAGKKLPDAVVKAIQLVIDKNTYTVTITGEGDDKGTLKFDSSAKQKTMDVVGTDGPNKGKTFLAIYELDGDTLTICYNLDDGKERPTEFKTKEKTKLYLVTYKRKK